MLLSMEAGMLTSKFSPPLHWLLLSLLTALSAKYVDH